MQERLFRPLVAAVVSMALALTGMTATTTAARADSRDAAAVIAGVIALYAIGRVIENRNDARSQQPGLGAQLHRPGTAYGYGNGGHRDDRYQRGARVIPAACYREFPTRQGIARGYIARCMQNNVQRPALLPPECIMQIQTRQGARNLYDARCLARNGWQQEVRDRR